MEVKIKKTGNMWIAYNDVLKTLYQSHNRQEVEIFVIKKHNLLTCNIKEKYIPPRQRKYGRIINY